MGGDQWSMIRNQWSVVNKSSGVQGWGACSETAVYNR